MISIHLDSGIGDEARRQSLYRGDLYVYTPHPSTLALVELAREMCREAFAPFDPQTAQYEMEVERYAKILGALKPAFIHHPECKRLLPGILTAFGCDPEQTCFDVPRLRTSTSDDYLTTGIAYAFHPHRDTWYSAPACQINWWLPVYELDDNGLNFHPGYFDRAIQNGSSTYNYQEWNQHNRFDAAKHIGVDSRVQPRPEEPIDGSAEIRPVTAPGGMILFSAAHLHGSVTNRSGSTRISIDFRSVHLGDAQGRAGAPNVDARCTGSSIGDFLRCSDLEPLPEPIVADYLANPSMPAY